MNPQYFDLGVKIMKRVSTSYTRDDLVGSMGVTKLSKEKVVSDEGLIHIVFSTSKKICFAISAKSNIYPVKTNNLFLMIVEIGLIKNI